MATAKEKLIAGAQKLVEKGAFEKAIKEYLRVVQEDDSDVRIWLKIGDLYAKIGKKQEATDTYQRVAQFYSDQGFYLKSVAVYKQILKLDPRLVDVNQRLAELYKQLGLISDAINQYEQVASFFHKENRVREALSAMKQIVDLDPETVAARIKLAEMYSHENMPREAIDEFTRAAEQLKEQGRVDEYMKVAERLLFHAPDNRPVTKELARLYIDKNDPRRALPKLQVLFKADPRDLDVLRLLARAFEGLEQRPKAVSVYKELARILNESGDQRGAADVFRQIQAIQPDDPDAEAALRGQAGGKGGSGTLRPPTANRPTPAPLQPPAANPRNLPTMGPMRAHGTGAERALDSGGYRAINDPPSRPNRHAMPEVSDGSEDLVGEEIAKILNETDVYIKYNLHAKAIEHLQRVFERSPRNVPAREKLKALYITTGKKDEAILELWALAENAEQGRARRYIREIYELDPTNVRAAQLLGEATRAPGQAAEPEPEDEFGIGVPQDFELPSSSRKEEPQTRRASSLAPAEHEVDDIEFEEEADLESLEVLPESMEPVAAPSAGDFGSLDEGLDIETASGLEDEDDLIPVVIDTGASRAIAAAQPADDEDRFSLDTDEPSVPTLKGAPRPRREEAPSQPDIVQPETLQQPDYEHSGPEDATRFGGPSLVAELTGSDEPEIGFDLPEGEGTAQMALQDLAFDEPAPQFVQAVTTQEPMPEEMSSMEFQVEEPSARILVAETEPHEEPHVVETSQPRVVPAAEPVRSDSSLEDDLDESDFFMQQSLFDEARSMLTSLLERYPAHPLVSAKLRELDTMERGAPASEEPPPVEPMPIQSALSAQLPTDLPGLAEAQSFASEPTSEPVEVTRRGVIERGVSAEDFETHYDLGIAYKEMGLIEAAITEFKIVMKDTPREVQCHLMIGLCHIERQAFTEAINQFKKGLYVEGITDPEALSLYYELGQAYEHVGDPREALYYYDKVQKREPKFRDLQRRMRALRGEEQERAPAAQSEELDDALDALLDEG